jgi:hypothetical protein
MKKHICKENVPTCLLFETKQKKRKSPPEMFVSDDAPEPLNLEMPVCKKTIACENEK